MVLLTLYVGKFFLCQHWQLVAFCMTKTMFLVCSPTTVHVMLLRRQGQRGLSRQINLGHCRLVTKSCPTLMIPMDCSPPGSSVDWISQTRILEWVAVFFSMGSSRSRDQTRVSCIAGRFFTTEPPGLGYPAFYIPFYKAKKYINILGFQEVLC